VSGLTPSQTVGPFFAYGLTSKGEYDWPDAFSSDLITPDVSGQRIRVHGIVYDGDGAVVPDAMIEIWQADAQGRFSDPRDPRGASNTSFRGFGRCGTSPDGAFAFDTIKPGAVPGETGAAQAPHILVAIFARGMLLQLYTRIYFPDEDNASDAVLALVPEDRRATLIATRDSAATANGAPALSYRFDIRLQGASETVFFEV
jgi:protocatechuate 3,4-dioxygenase alpha subunit